MQGRAAAISRIWTRFSHILFILYGLFMLIQKQVNL